MMKTTLLLPALTLATLLSASAAISIENQAEGFLGSDKTQVTSAHNGTTQISYNATGIDKLVVVFATESGFNNTTTTAMTMSFNGVAMTQAAFQQAFPNPILNDNGAVAIFYLDDPFQGAANFTAGVTNTGGGPNGGHISILGLTGTQDGIGAVAGTSHTDVVNGNNVGTSITATAANSLVIAGIQASGQNNVTGGFPTAVSPLTLSNNGGWGSGNAWGHGASGYQSVPVSGTTITPTFVSGTSKYVDVAAVEFLPAAPAPPFQLAITPTTPPATGYDFSWPSQPDKVYDLLTSTDLADPISAWLVYDDGTTLHEAIPSAGETTTLTAIPSVVPRRFFAVREYDAPPPPPPPVESELSSVWGSGTTVTLNFTEAMDEATATDPSNYEVFNLDVFWPVTSAMLSPDGKTVTLTLGSALSIDTTFSVTLNNLTSSDGTPLGGSTTVQFQTWDDDPEGIKVFILAGQSNMVGFGHSETGNGGVAGAIGSLRHLAVNNASFPDYDYASLLVNPADPANSAWRTRGDVKAWWKDGGMDLGGTVRKGDLGPPFLGTDAARYGPEYAFGQVMGDYYVADDVLVIKAAWGGRSLAVDFRPPSAVAARGGAVGPFYQGIFDNVRDVLASLGTEFPQWSAKGYQIVGFGWHQGWNDRVTQAYNDEYEANMKNFIDDVRIELGQPALPFVIATTGMTGWTETHPRALSLMNAQLAMANFTKYPDFEGNVDVIDTRDFWRDAAVSPINQGFHWNQNGETLFLIGKSMGDRMVNLLAPSE